MKKYILGSLLILIGTPAYAGDEIGNNAVFGSHCTPVSDSSASRLYHGVQGWSFIGSETGYATLVCSVPMMRGSSPAAGAYTFTYYVMFADDFDGTASASHVRASFYETSLINYNATYFGSVYTNSGTTSANPRLFFGFPKRGPRDWYFSLLSNYIYQYYVTLYRNSSTTRSPVFSGIMFIQL